MADELIRTYTEGDTAPNLVREVLAETAITDLTGYTVRLRIVRPDGIDIEKEITTAPNADGEIDDPTGDPPAFFFTFLATDLVAGNLQRAEIEYDDGSGAIATERNIFFNVGEAIG